MREWFCKAFQQEIRNSDKGHPIIARENQNNKVVGIIALRLMGNDERGSGMWTKDLALSPKQEVMYNDMVDSMTLARERLMLGDAHYLIQLFGVDDEFKGLGLGQRLLEQACYTADQDDFAIFVQSNKYTKDLYLRHGFVERDVVKMPKDPDYTEHMLVRPKQSAETKT
jgi:ribosomal protein S18 acetylase RimI-like enzyme